MSLRRTPSEKFDPSYFKFQFYNFIQYFVFNSVHYTRQKLNILSMSHIQLDQDIRSLSDFRANAASFIERVKSERRPLILTQHGKSSAVLIDVEDYQKMLDKIQLLEELSTARKELNNGEGVEQEEFFSKLRSDFSS